MRVLIHTNINLCVYACVYISYMYISNIHIIYPHKYLHPKFVYGKISYKC